jgi:hypothetical protein
MNMKKFIAVLFSLAVTSFAANVQILEPTGADFSADAPTIVKSLLRAAVSKSGNTPVEDASEIQLRTSIMSMGGHLLVVCEQLKGGAVVISSKQKSIGVDDLDVAIEKATVEALLGHQDNLVDQAPAENAQKSEPLPVNTSVITVEVEEKPAEEKPLEKRPTRNYNGFGLGVALWHNYDYSRDTTNKDDKDVDRDWSTSFVFHYARIFEVSNHAAITLLNNMDMVFGKGWQIHETFLIGGRYYIQSGAVSPYFGAGIGLGGQFDNHYAEFSEYFAIGIAGGVEAGVVFFRNSAMQLELGAAWDALWDGFESFDRRFGAGSLYIAINY